MDNMTNEQAASILDPETSREALAPYAHDCQLRLAVTEEACTVAAKVLRREGWISVKERIPNKGENVLVFATGTYCKGWKFAIDRLEDGEKNPRWLYTHGWFKVTHWMPLPEPPKED